jgi:hypothetical protein
MRWLRQGQVRSVASSRGPQRSPVHRIIRAFLIEEAKIVKKVLKAQPPAAKPAKK